MSSRNSVSDRFYRALYAVLASPELTKSTKAPMFLALLFKALKQDVSPKRVAAFAKRLLQVASEAPANFACGCLMLTSELLKTRPGLWNAVLQGEEKESDAVEKFKDVEEKEEEEQDFEIVPATDPAPSPATATKQQHPNNESSSWPMAGSYDMRKREPQFANAERSCFWELLPLASHAHPSVAAMARTLLAGANVSYDGDPLQDLTLHAFLDKFIQKKAKVAARGDSLMQPIRAGGSSSVENITNAGGIVPLGGAAGAAAVGAAFSALDSRDIAPDDAFFYKFYSLQAANGGANKKKKKKSKGGADDDEALVSDEDGDGGSDDDDAMDDFLAGEEDGGDEGIGADPDTTFKSDFDYSELEAAMMDDGDMSGEESESEEDDDGAGDISEEEEERQLNDSGRQGHGRAAGGDNSDDDDDDDVESLDGAEFSDLSEGNSSEEEEEGEEDLEEDSEESDDGDAAADAEIAGLLEQIKNNNKKRKKGANEASDDDEIPDDINPFDLAEATDSEAEELEEEEEEFEEEGAEGGSGSDGSLDSSDDEDEEESGSDDDFMLDEDMGSDLSDLSHDDHEDEDDLPSTHARSRKGKNNKEKPVFASADDFDDLIIRDLDGKVDEEEAEKVKADAGYRSKGGGRGRGGGGGRGRGRGKGGGRGRGRESTSQGAAKRQRK
jgi:ribosome biogenesis protein MAK21